MVRELTRALKAALPQTALVYGGVYPTFAWRRILSEEPQIDVIVRGEGEETAVRVANALAGGRPLDAIPGLACRRQGRPHATPPAPLPRDLDALRCLIAYDPDQIQLLYATPHHWTALAQQQAGRRVLQTDLRKWDYKHQVLVTRHVPAWGVLLWVKLIEAVMQVRPRSLGRLFGHPDLGLRAAMRWYYRIGRPVWPYEIWQFLVHDRRTLRGPALAAFQQPERAQGRRDTAARETDSVRPGRVGGRRVPLGAGIE